MSLITAQTKRDHRVRWFVYTGRIIDGVRERIPHEATMRGFWPGYDVVCSCGWKTATGGGIRRYVEDLIWDHRYSAQCEKDEEAGR